MFMNNLKPVFYFLIIVCSFLTCNSIKNVKPDDFKIETIGEKPMVLRQPYLQMVRPTSTIVTWKTNNIAKNCYVIISKGNKSEKSITKGFLTEHEGNIFNQVELNNLQPSTKYYYSLYTNGHLMAEGSEYFFITAPITKKPFSFYALGDIGAPESFSFAKEPANRITELKTKPDFGLGLGDIVYPKGESKNYDNHLFKPFEEVFKNIPFYPVPGNHDWLSDPEKNFEIEWALPNNEHYYSFSYSNTLFIGLDSSNGGFYNVEAQVAWLKQTLKNNMEEHDWIIVYLHHNGKTCTYKPNYEHVLELYKILAENKVDVVLNGHAHTYERLKPYDKNGDVDLSRTNETEYKNLKNRFISVTIGAGGKINKKWEADPNDPKNCNDGTIVAYAEHVPSFGLFNIEGNTLEFKAINSFTGEMFDEFKIVK